MQYKFPNLYLLLFYEWQKKENQLLCSEWQHLDIIFLNRHITTIFFFRRIGINFHYHRIELFYNLAQRKWCIKPGQKMSTVHSGSGDWFQHQQNNWQDFFLFWFGLPCFDFRKFFNKKQWRVKWVPVHFNGWNSKYVTMPATIFCITIPQINCTKRPWHCVNKFTDFQTSIFPLAFSILIHI